MKKASGFKILTSQTFVFHLKNKIYNYLKRNCNKNYICFQTVKKKKY